jgi:hypothetical protein
VAKVLVTEDNRLIFVCPGCGNSHDPSLSRWAWNGNPDLPTITPSILVLVEPTDPTRPKKVCHSFVTDGKIRFLADCTHRLAGQEVELEDYE